MKAEFVLVAHFHSKFQQVSKPERVSNLLVKVKLVLVAVQLVIYMSKLLNVRTRFSTGVETIFCAPCQFQ